MARWPWFFREVKRDEKENLDWRGGSLAGVDDGNRYIRGHECRRQQWFDGLRQMF
jgi:hypothetical protein